MGGSLDDVHFLLASVSHEIRALRRDRRLSAPVDGTRGGAMRQHVLDLIGAAEHWLELKPDSAAPQFRHESFSRTLRNVMLNLREAHAAMPWLAATRTPLINLGSLYLAEEIAEILVGKDLDLVIVPDPEYMYATQSWPFREVIERAEDEGFQSKTTQRPVVLHYPLSDGNRLLLHAIFGHELGHSAVQQKDLVQQIYSRMVDDQFLRELNEVVTNIWPSTAPEKSARTIGEWLKAWIEELLCDHLAAQVVGPSYLWAFAGFVMPLSYGDPQQSYPPNTVRVRLLLEQLRDLGWSDFLSQVAPHITAWLDRVGQDGVGPLGRPFDFLRDQVIRHAAVMRETASAVAKSNHLAPDPTINEVDEAVSLLDQLVLPVGSDPPLAPRAILLGGWRRALAKHGDEPQSLVAALDDSQLHDLIGKAIEMSVVVSCWEQQ